MATRHWGIQNMIFNKKTEHSKNRANYFGAISQIDGRSVGRSVQRMNEQNKVHQVSHRAFEMVLICAIRNDANANTVKYC